MKTIIRKKLGFYNNDKCPVISAKQYDTSRIIEFTVFDGNKFFDMSDVIKVTLRVQKADGKQLEDDSCILDVSKSTVSIDTSKLIIHDEETYKLGEQLLAAPGINVCELRFEKNEEYRFCWKLNNVEYFTESREPVVDSRIYIYNNTTKEYDDTGYTVTSYNQETDSITFSLGTATMSYSVPNELLTTWNFVIDVEPLVHDGSNIVSSDVSRELDTYLETAQNIISNYDEIIEYIDNHLATVTQSVLTVGDYSQAVGYNTTASGIYSHAEGVSTTASAHSAHTEGSNTTASGSYSHAEGNGCTSIEDCSHAQNLGTIAASFAQTALGKYNIQDDDDDYAIILGNGVSNNNRSNALTVNWNGDVVTSGDITDGDGNVLSQKADITDLDSKADITDLDSWTESVESIDGETVTFTGLNPLYGYQLFCENKLVFPVSVEITEDSNTNTESMTYVVDGIEIGDLLRLRIYK